MNATIDYTARAQTILGVLSMRAASPANAGHIEAAKLRLLDRIERGLADRLHKGGVSSEAAAQSAFEFVRQVAARHKRAGSERGSQMGPSKQCK